MPLKLIKKAVRGFLKDRGFTLYRNEDIPFGCDICADLRRMLPPRGLQVAFDVGANVGQTANKLLQEFPGARIYSFEPFPATFQRLQLLSQHSSRVRCYPLACGARPGTLRVPACPEESSHLNSLVAANHAKLDSSAANLVDIKIVAIDDFCREEKIERIDLLKTDTEGFDLEVLKGAAQMLESGNVDFVYSECEFSRVLEELHTDFFELHDWLSKRKFRLVTVYTDRASRDGFMWGSALFARQGG